MKIAHDCVTVMGVFWGGEAMADNRTEGAASPLTGPQAFCKRLGDLVLSAAGLLVLSPLLLAVAAAIRLSDGGPVLFTQDRVTKGGRVFRILKFRTMRLDTPPDLPSNMLEDPERYLLRCGKTLRQYSLDELPQLVNILKGDMSVVGPRPLIGRGNESAVIEAREKCGANDIRPGLTGLAQISGRDLLDNMAKARLDGEYVRRQSFLFDCRCFFRTIGKVITHEGVK